MKQIALLLILTSSAIAQRSDTVFQTIVTGLASAAIPYTSSTIRNIGQGYHTVYVIATNSPGNVCTSADAIDVFLNASFDSVNYFQLSSNRMNKLSTNVPGTSLYGNVAISGIAPFLKVGVRTLSVNCLLTIYYGGSLYPVSTSKLEARGYDNAVETTIMTIASMDNETLEDLSGSNRDIILYGLVCSCLDVLNIGLLPMNIVVNDQYFSLAPGVPLVLPPTGLPYGISNQFVIINNDAQGTAVNCKVIYRFE